MRLTPLMLIAAIAALVAAAAAAQTPASDARADRPTVADSAPAAGAPADQASTLKAVEITLVSNGPVPDTAANRRLYGGPTSNAGRRSAPRGN